ncbi:uncharacterized protein [Argopecten irradians]|uniref:uncharacterized protein n=1 Tax=Argopecten irradians TaxID=31199 RepID=UPI0037152395
MNTDLIRMYLNIITIFIVCNRCITSAGFCDTLATGFYSDPTSCYKYIQCDTFGTTFNFECNVGLIWDNDLQLCNIDTYNGNCVPPGATVTSNCATYCKNITSCYAGPEVIEVIFADSFVGCAKACKQSVNYCEGFNFLSTQQSCELFSSIVQTAFIVEDSCLFGQICLGP